MGQTFGRYRLLERIGQGGMAEVFRAKSYGVEGFEKVVVIKRILPELAERAEFLDLFVREAKLAVRLSHANIVQAFDLGIAKSSDAASPRDAYYIAMEHVHGLDLAQVLTRARREGKKLPSAFAVYVCSEVAKGLDYAHRRRDEQMKPLGIVHRDVSPQNVLLSFEGEVKVADFGIAKALGVPGEDDNLEDTGARRLKGKFAYMSPEQAAGEAVDARSDIFSLGVVLYECITGVNPFAAPSTLETLRRVLDCEYPPLELLEPDTPAELLGIVQRALAKERERRFADAGRLHEALLTFLYGQTPRFTGQDLSEWLAPFRAPAAALELDGKLLTQDKTPASLRRPAAVLPSVVSSEVGDRAASFGERRDATALAIDWGVRREGGDEQEQQASLLLDRYGGKLLVQEPTLTVALFGLSEPDGHDTEVATRCALAMLRLGERAPRGVGVHAARIVVDAAGEPRHDDTLASLIDTARSLSRRAEAACVVSAQVRRMLPAGVSSRELDASAAVVHGFDESSQTDLRFQGRRDELRRVGEALALATKKRSKVVVIRGEQGVGKTRLVREVERRLRKGGYAVALHLATCLPQGRTFPYSGIVCMLQVLLGFDEGASGEQVLATRPRLRALGLTDDELTAVYSVLGVSSASPQSSLEGSFSSAFAQIVKSLSEDAPQVFAWDSAQCMDQESLGLLGAVHQRLPRARAVFLLAARTGASLSRLAEDSRVEIELADLGPHDARKLVEDRLGVERLPDELLAFLAERAGGHPLFLLELTRALLDARALTVAEGQVVELHVEGGELALPRTLRGLVASRLSDLATHERAVLQAMAVMGESARLDVLARVLELPEDDLDRVIGALEHRELLQLVGDRRHAFRSPVVREVVASTLLTEAKRALHGAVAEALIALPEPGRPPSSLVLAEHFDEADRGHQASVYYADVSRRELARGRAELAVRHGVRALRLVDAAQLPAATLVEWLASLADAARLVRRVDDASMLTEKVLRRVDNEADVRLRVRARIAAGRVLGSAHLLDAARAAFTTAEHVAVGEQELELQAIEAAAELAARQGDFSRALGLYTRVEALAERLGESGSFKRAVTLAFLHAAAGDIPAAHRALATAVRRAGDEPVALLEVEKTRGVLAYYAGLHADSVHAFELAVEKARALGLTYEVAVNLHNAGDVYLRLGDRARAYGAFHQSLALALEAGHERLANHDRMFVAYLDALSGATEAGARLAAAITHAEQLAFTWDALNGLRLEALWLEHCGEVERAKAAWTRLLERAVAHGHRALETEIRARGDLPSHG